MQTLSANLAAALLTIDARVNPRVLVDVYEFYPSDTIPGVSGFDPADAVEQFAPEELTWNGIAYRREVVGRGDISKSMGEKTNQCTIEFSNVSRYLATWATTTQIEGLFCVIRTICPTVTDDSVVLFVGRAEKPSDIDQERFSITIRQDFGNINQEIPPREFTAEDPSGRTPSDPLYEGFRLSSLSGTHQIPVQVPSTSFFGRLFGRTRTEYQTQQWSSLDSTPYGNVLPLIFGRCQMELIPILFADIGWALIGVWVVGEGRVDDFTDVRVRDSRFQIVTTETHMGDPGGTGTNSTSVSGPINQGYLSKTAYVVISMSGTTVEVVDDAPLITALVRGVRVPLPNSSGVYGTAGWSDNPVHIARFILTDSRLVGIDQGFMEDSVNYQTALHCDEPLIDDSNGEVTLLTDADLPQAGTGITRFRATGIIDPKYVRHHLLGEPIDPPEYEPPIFDGFPIDNIPTVFPIQRILRKRYTANFPLTDKMRAVDCLYKILAPAAKLFLRVNKRGKYEIRTEKPSDATMIRSATAVNATAIPVLDVTPWKTGDLLQGRIMLGFGLTTSEVRDVTSADYSADGNAITLTTSVTGGGVTSTASGATLTGGSTTVQASGTITVGGTPAAGNTITVTLNGIAIIYTLVADDSTGTVAAILASLINATPRLRRYLKASWSSASPTIVTITASLGVLNVPVLLKVHTAPIADPTTTPVLTDSAGSLLAGTYKVAYSDVTALGKSALSPTASRTIAASKKIDVGAIALVGTSRNWYMSDAANSEYLRFVANTNGSAFSLTALPLPGAALPPQYNSTGEELIRIAMSFATNSQDVYSVWPASTLVVMSDIYLPTTPNGHKYQITSITTGITGATEPTWPLTAGGTVIDGGVTWTEIGATYLGQAGLTRANIKKDTFRYPLGSRQSSVNQVKISYRDANNDFARTPFRVNDPIHQAQVNKTYPMEVDGSAIDNFNQMFRIANWALAKHREGDWFDTFGTGPQGLVLEEGDVICASDDSGGLVNQVTRIEELRIHPNHDVTIAQARKYSTNMFSDDVGADIIPVPTTLRYVETVDTIVEFIDNFPIHDADGLVAGFYVAMSRDLTIEGDWRGAALYADYGDGYVEIGSSDIPAVIGTATTTLGTVTDTSVPDYVNSLTFTLHYGAPAPAPPPFATVTKAQLVSNPRRNLFLVGNEYIQALTVVNNGNQSYTISTLLRGRFGTDTTELTHTASERVVFLNGSEKLITIDPVRLNAPFNYKAVTINQDVADATPESFTWTGGTLRPLSPVNIRGTRNAVGDLLIQWTRRSRAGQSLRDFSNVPVAEEIESYGVGIYSGATLKRTILTNGRADQPVLLEADNATTAALINRNTLNSLNGHKAWAASIQRFYEPSVVVSATLTVSGDLMYATIGLQDASFVPGETITKKYQVTLIQDTGVDYLRVHESGVQVYSVALTAATGITTIRVWIEVVDGAARFFRQGINTSADNFTGYGPGAAPFYVGEEPLLLPLRVMAATRDDGGAEPKVENIIIGGASTQAVYTAEQQVEDFGSTQSSVKTRVYQISSVVGPGAYREKNI